MSADRRAQPDDAAAFARGLTLLAESLPPRVPEPAQRARLLAALRGRQRWTPWASELARLLDLQLGDALDALQRIEDGVSWRPGLWPGSSLITTPSLQRRFAMIARMPAGMRIPRHHHYTRELTWVLDGVLIEDGHVCYGSGELLDKPRTTEHEVAVSTAADCLAVFAVFPE